ncbi:MAG: magnesium transporter [Alphaproteobacteria bacterium]|nr:magnesium transporter [Alphaproteobacteria bacterium]
MPTDSLASSGAQTAPSRSVAAFVDANIAAAAPEDKAAAVRARLMQQTHATVDPVFVLAEGRRLAGAVALPALLVAAESATMEDLMTADWPQVQASATSEDAASLAVRSRTATLAVTDHAGAFLGAVTPSSLMEILRAEHLEDLHHMAGILGRSEEAKAALTAPPFQRALYRLPWLLVGLLGSAVATALMAGAETVLHAHIAIAFFIPAIIYLADAIGTQSEAVAVRGLSLTEGASLGLLAGELGTGALLGAALALLSFLGVWTVFADARLAAAVALALAAAGTVAAAVGFLLPWAFHRSGFDPAHGSGPVGTVIQDVLSLAVYLAMVALLVA